MTQRLVTIIFLVVFSGLAHGILVRTADAQQPGQGPARARWSHDGTAVVLAGKWRDPITWKEVPANKPAKTGPSRDNTQSLFLKAVNAVRETPATDRDLRTEIKRGTLPRGPVANPGVRISKDRDVVVAGFGGEVWSWRKGEKAKKLAGDLEDIRHFAISPAGNAASYISKNDLYIADTKTGKVHRLTKDGGENTFNGELDWVYQEEVYGRGNFQAAWWAPSGTHLVYMRTDETGVDTFNVIDHVPNQLGVEQLKYPKAGRTNPRATLHVGDAADGKVVTVDLSSYDPKDEILIVRVGWTPKGDQIIYMIQNREQTWLDLNFADPKTGKTQRIIHEESQDSWVERLPMPRWLEDGTFLWESDRTGYRHFYRYSPDGKLVAAISHGEWSAGQILVLDEKGGWMGFTGNTPTYSIGQNAYYATLDGKTLHRVTKGRGNHRVSFNHDGSAVLDTFNHLENPGEQWLRKNDGTDIRKIYSSEAPRNATYTQWRQIKARDGETLDITYTLPRNFDEKMKYPVWIQTYSGPAAPNVRDIWMGPSRGRWYIVLQVNVRSASTRGMKLTKTCYKQFGVQELKDLEDATDWLCAHPWADASRVGIQGWSYGGFMTAFALTHSKKFKCGIAGAGVYDWALYDTIYTERYMMKPQNNSEGYAASSVVAAAKNLHGQLLIQHGTMDDNVHMQNSIQLIHALQQANKTNFTFMLYPKSRHGVMSRHRLLHNEKFMRENL